MRRDPDRPSVRSIAIACVLATSMLWVAPSGAEGVEGDVEAPEAGSAVNEYAPSKQHPFGRPNPAAPPELKQFAFMVGEFDRVDQYRNQDGSWRTVKGGRWDGRYALNGFAIQDHSYRLDPKDYTTNIRVYDPDKKIWVVTWIKMPGYSSLVAEGALEGERIVIRNGDTARFSFYDISENGYKWIAEFKRGEHWVEGWRILCTRRSDSGG